MPRQFSIHELMLERYGPGYQEMFRRRVWKHDEDPATGGVRGVRSGNMTAPPPPRDDSVRERALRIAAKRGLCRHSLRWNEVVNVAELCLDQQAKEARLAALDDVLAILDGRLLPPVDPGRPVSEHAMGCLEIHRSLEMAVERMRARTADTPVFAPTIDPSPDKGGLA